MTRDKLLLLDFDGTLCLGDDPVLAYAGQVDAMLAERGLTQHLPRPVQEIVAGAFDAGSLLVEEIAYAPDGRPRAASHQQAHSQEAHPLAWPLQDGYQLTQLLAHQAGLDGAESGAAFRAARRELLARGLEHTDLHAPDGARELIVQLRSRQEEHGGVIVVLATNSPAEGFGTWLEALELQGAFDAVISSARKPLGMPATLQQALATGKGRPVDPTDVLSLGDIWANDLADVAELGGTTVLIDRFGTGLGAPDHRVPGFAEAEPVIRRWAGQTALDASGQGSSESKR